MLDLLPTDILFRIYSYLPYTEISQLRHLNYCLNEVCKYIHNDGFKKLQTDFALLRSKCEYNLNHTKNPYQKQLMRYVYGNVHIKLSMLVDTYGLFIRYNMCCFIPGKALDDIYKLVFILQRGPGEYKFERMNVPLCVCVSGIIKSSPSEPSITLYTTYISGL